VIDDVLSDTKSGMEKAIEAFERELAKVRTGRANLSLLDGVKVDYYGSPTPLSQVASLNVAEARLMTVKPWDKNMIPLIDKAIRAADLGINPISDAELIRLPIPALTKERRNDLAKQTKKMAEDARIAVRAARRDGNDMLRAAEKEKEVSEDESKQGQKQIQELTDEYVAKIDKLAAAKEQDILTI